MEKEFIYSWEAKKHLLREHFEQNLLKDTAGEYDQIVKCLFSIVFNELGYDLQEMKIIDHGDYQGTRMYFIPKKTYQPNPKDYVWIFVDYGSCSGCDTLLDITNYSLDVKPKEYQVEQLMTMALHITQAVKKLFTQQEEDEYYKLWQSNNS